MSYRKVGQLRGARDPTTIEWEIADFLQLSAEVNESHQSRVFFFCDAFWLLKLYPNGEVDDSSNWMGQIRVYLFRADSGPPVSVAFSFFLRTADSRKELVGKFELSEFEDGKTGWGTGVISRSELIQQKSKFLPSGALTVVCCLKSSETSVVRGTKKLSEDLTGLLASGFGSDVTIKVQGEELRLHRAILGARTPVFNSMFAHDMQEKATGVVCIDDCDAGTFRDFVRFLYSGGTDRISPGNVYGLYTIADKYQVDELKDSCLEFMARTLCVDSFCRTLEFALRHETGDLIQLAADFLSKNASDVMGTEEWQNLMANNMKQMNELLMQVIEHKNKKIKLA